ncbi:MAG TPA: tRNA (adenosine(37)-N6)-dimethylallyltransferase MiaA [Steroidobacteraceae bacterium]|nr:tRNA (adenosine(37)-N6)-dimethylallyltransferase MiaA [Steroidobacteraceae bacterium]
MRRVAVLLMGPTGAGKSEAAIRLAQRFALEIISVDSALVYRGMDIGTAKPSAATRARIVHHLVDIRDPAESYSAGEFVRDAERAMQAIWSRGRQPLLVGGTMLYFHALTEGIAALPAADRKLRAEIDAMAAQAGWAAVHGELARIDPAAASRIHANDPQRIQRAIEVFRLTGTTITQLREQRRAPIDDVRFVELALAPAERGALHAALARRFEAMLEAGLLEEVRGFYRRGDLGGEQPSMRAVGYRQLWQHLAGEFTLQQATDRAIAASRQLAKRQFTWLRRRTLARWFDSGQPEAACAMGDALAECLAPLRNRKHLSNE